ncbi:MAG: phenylalanine--tRNA ligase subunit beta [Holosporales bacterium]|jgi:phenylalanyl-tRNA synthetase beta chain|nr:phenylalanine--tRNA ligase subunit beta [Holosporales bacterium]
MKFSYSWLKDHLDTNYTAQEIANRLNEIGFEVEELNDHMIPLRDITVARIEAVETHPNANKLHICRVFDGHNTLQIVCGAPNVYGGMHTALVHIGGFVPKVGAPLKEANIRGVLSQGMMCSYEELCLPDPSQGDGIIDLHTDVAPGQPIANALGLDDPVFTVSITPNRGDCFSVRGIARELAAAGMGTLKLLNYAQHFDDLGPIDLLFMQDSPVKISIETEKCPSFIGAVMSGVHNCFSPLWIQKRLMVAGQKPIDALVDVTNFLNFDIGQPLHVYDRRHINGDVHIRQARDGEQIKLLNGQDCTLCSSDVVIADDKAPLTIAGIMGGELSGSSIDTTDIFLEAAYFDPISVTLSGQRHVLQSESRTRFERGVDPNLAPIAIGWALALIHKMCGGEILGGSHMQPTPPPERPCVTMTRSRLTSLGGDPSASEGNEAANILSALGFEIISNDDEQITVRVPSWRHDVSIDADLIEEVLRIRGYANLPIQELPSRIATAEIDPIAEIKAVLYKRGMAEVYTLPFLSQEETQLFSSGESDDSFIEILKPLNADMAFLQKSLVSALLKVVLSNQNKNCSHGAIFEIESVFSQTSEGAHEAKMLCGMRFGETERNWLEPSRAVDIFDAKADLIDVLALCQIDSYQIRNEGFPSYYHPTRSGVVARGKNVLGFFGELHPAFVKKLGLIGPIVMFEFFVSEENVGAIAKTNSKNQKPFHYSKFQPITRDFAFIVDKSLPAHNLLKAVKNTSDLIVNARIFDVFQGASIPADKKSVAVEVVIQPEQSTLTDECIHALTQQVVAAVEKNCGGQIRA